MSGDPDRRSERPPSSPGVSELRERVDKQLASARNLIGAMERDIASYRDRIQQLTSECERLRAGVAAGSVAQLQCAQYETQLRASRQRERQLQDANAALERENSKLSRYCAGVELALGEEREHRELTELELMCLQEQVELLQATVDDLTAAAAGAPDRDT